MVVPAFRTVCASAILGIAVGGCGETRDMRDAREHDPSVVAITRVLRDQADGWNRGDVGAFMRGYWESPELTFSSGGKTTRGWQATLERYKTKYPTSREMGRLTFDQLEVRPLDRHVALVLGNWQLERDSGPIGGNFSLVFQEFPNAGWRIVHDHTSVAERSPEPARAAP